MGFTQLVHDKSLGLPTSKKMIEIPIEVMKYAEESSLVSFRDIIANIPILKIKNINACTRFINTFKGNIVFYSLEGDSPLAPLILWDVAHTLEIGNTITMLGDFCEKYYYEKEYYKESLEIVERAKGKVVFKKNKELIAEKNKGLEDWTFGIPVGPEDATHLNAVVKRILELEIPKKEIILCGKPNQNFKYWDKVKIVGEDIPAPPVLIGKKKNRIVSSAQYNNICILHDRVFLPKDFYEAMLKYGDYYSYTTMQSLYFDDYYNMTPRRYSDYDCILKGKPVGGVVGVYIKGEKDNVLESSFKNILFADMETHNSYVRANILNYSSYNYPTGSLYIVKKSIWETCPQNEMLKWEEFEDVESGLRANSKGIVTRVNPYSFTQSISSRPIVFGFEGGKITYQNMDLKLNIWNPITDRLKLKRKPFIKMDENLAIEKLLTFQNKYCYNSINSIVMPQKLDSITRYKIILRLVFEAEFELTSKSIEEFIRDCNKFLFLDTIPYSMKRHLYYEFINNQTKAKNDILASSIILNQIALRKKDSIFYKTMKEYFIKDSLKLRLGTFLSAIYLRYKNKKITYNPNGIKGYYRAIINSTPFNYYIEEEAKNETNCN